MWNNFFEIWKFIFSVRIKEGAENVHQLFHRFAPNSFETVFFGNVGDNDE